MDLLGCRSDIDVGLERREPEVGKVGVVVGVYSDVVASSVNDSVDEWFFCEVVDVNSAWMIHDDLAEDERTETLKGV